MPPPAPAHAPRTPLSETPLHSDRPDAPVPNFRNLSLNEAVIKALDEVGYETPSPIQAATIPHMLAGTRRARPGADRHRQDRRVRPADPVAHRHEGAAPQALVLVPTRELAIQVAEAFQRYAAHIQGFHVLPIYGGQSYGPQLQRLRRGVHVVVGTPGRVIDHIEQRTR